MNYKSIANKALLTKSIRVPTSLKFKTFLVGTELDKANFKPRLSPKIQGRNRELGRTFLATSFGVVQAEAKQSFNFPAWQVRKHHGQSPYSKFQNSLVTFERGLERIHNPILFNQLSALGDWRGMPANFRRHAAPALPPTFGRLDALGWQTLKGDMGKDSTARITVSLAEAGQSKIQAQNPASQAQDAISSTNQAENKITKEQANLECSWERPTFPFTAIVGQEEMKLALLLNVIDPKIGGVMIMGDRGTGKSTTVRALVDLLPNIEVVDNDLFNSHPSDAELQSQNVREQVLQGKTVKVTWKKTAMIDLPLGATEDRVCGTIDIEKALNEGVKAFEPGLLAKANRGILYVDEVNLLDDHLVDILLDSAASGWNTVEREGISVSHPARFILVGSGNPEEGELRPQLLDRFGMHAQIGTVREAELRVKIVEERASFDKSPLEFLNIHLEKQKQLADQIVAARHLLNQVKIDYDLRVKISQVCGQLNVDGLRGDIVTNLAGK